MAGPGLSALASNPSGADPPRLPSPCAFFSTLLICRSRGSQASEARPLTGFLVDVVFHRASRPHVSSAPSSMTERFLVRHRGLILASVFFSLFLWKLPLHTQDGPNHQAVAATLARLSTSPVEESVYRSQLGPFHTNTLFHLIYLPATRVLSPATYEKLFVGVFLLLIPIAYRFFLSVWAPRMGASWVIALPLWFHPLFITGMYNFLASVAVALVALALMRRGIASGRMIHLAGFVLCSWIVFLAHPFPFFILVPALLVLAVTQRPSRSRMIYGYGAVTLAFLVVGFLIPLLRTSGGVAHSYIFKALPELLGGLFVYNVVGYSMLHLVLVVPFFLMLLGLMVYSVRTGRWQDKILWMLLLLGYFVFPTEGGGGAHLNERFLPFAWLFLPAGIVLQGARLRYAQYLSVATMAIMALGTFMGMRRIDDTVSDAQAVMEWLPDGARLYPINFDPHGPAINYSSLMHLWAVYDHEKTIFSPYMFAYMGLMPLSRREAASETYFPATAENLPERIASGRICDPTDAVETVPCETRRHQELQRIIRVAEFYDYWLVYRPPPDFRGMIESVSGVALVAQEGDVSLWRNENAHPFEPPL